MSKKVKILVVDDSKVNRLVLSRQLSKYGFEVAEAEDGREGLKHYINNKDTDLIITDLDMPNMNGYDFCSRVREYDKSMPIITNTDSYRISPALLKAAGFTGAIDKCEKAKELYSIIQNYLFNFSNKDKLNKSGE